MKKPQGAKTPGTDEPKVLLSKFRLHVAAKGNEENNKTIETSIKERSCCVQAKRLGQGLSGRKREASIRLRVVATLDALSVLQTKKIWSRVYRCRII